MTSILKVDNIRDSSDNQAISISNGVVTFANDVIPTDNVSDLGTSSSRYKDLFLSGGVYLGGTGSANKLDDYEEGTWTPSYSGVGGTNPTVTYTHQFGRYTKVGNKVLWEVRLQHSSSSGGSGTLAVNLPFASASNFYQVATVGFGGSFTVAVKTGYGDPSSSNMYFVQYNATGGNITTSSLNTGGGLLAMSGQYEV